MVLKNLNLQNFRNFQGLDLPLDQGFVVLSGPNGSGKTNFLEGIYFAASLRRFPESKHFQLFKDNEDYFRVKLKNNQDSFEVFSQKTLNGYSYQLQQNHQEVSRTKYLGANPVISFLPQDLNLLSRSPGARRYFLNEALSLVSAEYRYNHEQYGKSLRQRNNLWQKIALGEAKEEDLEIWDESLAEFGSQVLVERGEFLIFINLEVPRILSVLSPDLEKIGFIYQPSGAPEKAAMLASLQGLREKERQARTTVLGPHRDDFRVRINGKEAVGYLSRGQTRALVLALKMAERNYLEEKLKTPPIILLDDVFSEFDSSHQKHLLKFLQNFEQIFITTSHLEEIKDFLPEGAQIHSIEKRSN